MYLRAEFAAGHQLVVMWVRRSVVPDAVTLVVAAAPTAKRTAHPVQPIQNIGESVLGIRHPLTAGTAPALLRPLAVRYEL
jgi:hypothetical protein